MSFYEDSFHNYSMTEEPDKELYSPFLNEALFTEEEAEEEWEMRLMELQTPFLEDFEDRYEFSTEIEEEESESSYYKMDNEEFDENQTFEPYFLEKEEVLEEEEFETSYYEIEEEFDDDEILEDESESTYYEIDEEKFEEDETFDSYLLEAEVLEDEESELSYYEMDEEEFDEDQTFDSYFMEEELEEKSEQSYYEMDEEEFDEQEDFNPYYWEEGLDTELEDEEFNKELEEELSSKKSLTKLVKNALINKKWSLAIGLSIHAGNRDENSLTDMIFHARYPERKGRKLKRRERKLIKEWLKIRNTLVRKQLALPSPPIAQRGGIKCVSRRERKLADEKPDNPKTNITGRYENRFFDKKTRITVTTLTLNINQAGKHIECVMAEVLSPKSKKKKIPIYRLHGDLQNDGSYTLFSRTQPNFYARLYRRSSDGSLLIKIQTSSGTVSRERFVLKSSYPTLMEKPLSILPKGSGIIKRSQWTPLTREQLRYLREKLTPNKIIPYLKRYFSIDSDTKIDIRERLNLSAKQFDNYLEDVVFSEKFWHPTQLNLATFYAQRILARNRWTYKGVKRSFLDWIQIMLSIVASNREDWGRLRNIRKYLRLKADKDLDATRPPHTYKVTILVGGLQAGPIVSGGLFFGTIIIEKTSEPKWEKGEQEYAFVFGGISVGVGKLKAKMGVFAKGTATTSNNWTPGDFPGWVYLVEGGVSAGVGIGGQAGETLMFIDGRGFYPTMKVDLSGLSGTSQIGAGVEIGGAWGRIMELGRDFSKQDVSEIKIKTDYSVEYGLTQSTHFCLGSALLTEEARQALRIMCANELTSFMSPGSTLAIIGHTDRVGKGKGKRKEKRNLVLSAMRSQNTLQAIEDILGSKLKIPQKQIKPQGKGEQAAKKAGHTDKIPNAKDRRVDIILNSRLVLTLNG